MARPSPVPPNLRDVDSVDLGEALEQPGLVFEDEAHPGVGHLETDQARFLRLVVVEPDPHHHPA